MGPRQPSYWVMRYLLVDWLSCQTFGLSEYLLVNTVEDSQMTPRGTNFTQYFTSLSVLIWKNGKAILVSIVQTGNYFHAQFHAKSVFNLPIV